MFKEFKEFALRGSVLDLAIGIIIGAAFNPIVKSLVDEVLMPPIGLALGRVDFSNLFLTLKQGELPGPYPSLVAAREAGAVAVAYGAFVNTIINFLFVALAVFLLVKVINRWKREPAAADPTTRECPYCLSAIPLKATRCAHCTSELAAA
jgi:large conductance mechanosensitive channel